MPLLINEEASECHRQIVNQLLFLLAVGLSTVVYGIGQRSHIKQNLATIENGIHAAMPVININPGRAISPAP